MGVSLASSAIDSGCEVYWLPEGRSETTRRRAAQAGLVPVDTLDRLCELCPVIVSICPPEFAADVARQVAASGFRGVFLDANAGAPQHKIELAREMESYGVRFVDGGVIGLPSRVRGETTLFLSGSAAGEAAACFAGGAIAAEVIGTKVGRASALKVLFAAYNKGTVALFASLYAAAETYGVLPELQGQLVHRGLSLKEIETRILRSAPKAWRWVEEMHEISAALEAVGQPGEFHEAAAQVYERLREFKDAEGLTLAQVIERSQK
jgi:3-hydroxyisobutyrate dehydrogenase-like beta-hydroxyacid dehydrogenase